MLARPRRYRVLQKRLKKKRNEEWRRAAMLSKVKSRPTNLTYEPAFLAYSMAYLIYMEGVKGWKSGGKSR